MEVEHKGNTCIIKDTQDNLTAFLMKLTHEHKTFGNCNLILDISHYKNLAIKEINAFSALSKTHIKGKKSFVIVADIDFNKVQGKLVVVPTVQEAHDMIEMDEIERDLGF
ncbi:ribonuclease Z [Flavobacterium selenitireducens]|uniref:ribonuclease Z n=1 Tax=Flavobacterium selenitireducens TaxID=2722704 RepID=UPI00168B0472|nr:ribonuclease Z [Flavobacterium selenitireducens]MBD3581174.1 ribonuclease Z [Flavobacterium selenitireducens]